MNKFTKLRNDWTLIDDGIFRKIDSHNYRLVPPKWFVSFSVSETEGDAYLEEHIRRAGEMLVYEILENPFVKEEVDRRIQQAREDGYFGGLDEVKFGKRFDLDGKNV